MVNYLAEIPNFSARARAQRSSQPEAARFERICRVDPLIQRTCESCRCQRPKKGRALAESKQAVTPNGYTKYVVGKSNHVSQIISPEREKQTVCSFLRRSRRSLGLPLASRAAPAVDIWHIGKAAAKANTRP